MAKKTINKVLILTLSLAMVIISGICSHAENTNNRDEGVYAGSYMNMNGVDTNGSDIIDYYTDEVLSNIYWVDLVKKDISFGIHESEDRGRKYEIEKYGTVFPKYITLPTDTAVNTIAGLHNDLSVLEINDHYTGPRSYEINTLPVSGIIPSVNAMDTAHTTGLKYYAELPTDTLSNPFKFTKDEILRPEEIADPLKKLSVYSDLYVRGGGDSSAIGSFNRGDELPLEFSLNASWFKRYLKGFAIEQFSLDQYKYLRSIDEIANQFAISDSGFAFTIDIPKGVTVSPRPDVKVHGLDGFTPTTSIEDGKLIIRLSKDEKVKKYKWKDLLDKVYAIDASNIRVSISGLKVDNDATEDSNIKLNATVAGFYDIALSKTEEFYPVTDNDLKKIPWRFYMYFAAKQSDQGRDANAKDGEDNRISYTFKVSKKPQNKPSKPYIPVVPNNAGVNDTTTSRVDGRDRIETGIDISKKYYDKAKTVIVVRPDLFPDSMTASVLAKLKDAPILLNPTNKLDSRVAAEIKRLGADEVIIVGGQNSVSEKVREDLKAFDADKNVERIAGADRYETSEMVAKRVVGITGKKNTGVVASGQVFPDALSVGTFASREGYPILLVKKDMVPDQVERAISDLEIKKTYIAGGTNTISKATEAKLPSVVERMAGKDRYETSVAIAKSKFKDSKDAFIASGEEFADALVISPVSGKYNRPTLLASRNKNVNAIVKKYISDTRMYTITAIGGESYLPYSILLDLAGK